MGKRKQAFSPLYWDLNNNEVPLCSPQATIQFRRGQFALLKLQPSLYTFAILTQNFGDFMLIKESTRGPLHLSLMKERDNHIFLVGLRFDSSVYMLV